MNVTNLIDLGFTLLIIFMIATPLINQEQTIPVTLPSESKSPQQKVDKSTHFVAISIDAKGNTYLDERRHPSASPSCAAGSASTRPSPSRRSSGSAATPRSRTRRSSS